MENIGLIQKSCFETHGQKFVINCDTGSLFVSNNGVLYIYSVSGDNNSNQNMIDFNESSQESDNDILVLEHLPELDSVCCVARSGRVVLCDIIGLSYEVLEKGCVK